MNEYSDYILELYRNPVHKQRLSKPTHTATMSNSSCGDSITLDLQVEANTITAVGWDGTGCAISQAGMSVLADILVGKTLAEARALESDVITEEIGISLSPRRMRCALLGLEIIRNL